MDQLVHCDWANQHKTGKKHLLSEIILFLSHHMVRAQCKTLVHMLLQRLSPCRTAEFFFIIFKHLSFNPVIDFLFPLSWLFVLLSFSFSFLAPCYGCQDLPPLVLITKLKDMRLRVILHRLASEVHSPIKNPSIPSSNISHDQCSVLPNIYFIILRGFHLHIFGFTIFHTWA